MMKDKIIRNNRDTIIRTNGITELKTYGRRMVLPKLFRCGYLLYTTLLHPSMWGVY